MRNLGKILDIVVPFSRVLRRANVDKSSVTIKQVMIRGVLRTFLFFWLASFIPLVGTLAYTLILIPMAAHYHSVELNLKTREAKANNLLWYFVVITIGFGGLWGFIGHTFLADYVALKIGWLPDSPFQTELAFYHLGFGIAGLMAIWIRDHLITGLVIVKSVFWYGAAFVHIQDAIISQNFEIYNVGPPLIGDILLPTVFLILLYRARNFR